MTFCGVGKETQNLEMWQPPTCHSLIKSLSVLTARAVGDAPTLFGKRTQLADLLFVYWDAHTQLNYITFNQAIYLHAHLVFALGKYIFTLFALPGFNNCIIIATSTFLACRVGLIGTSDKKFNVAAGCWKQNLFQKIYCL